MGTYLRVLPVLALILRSLRPEQAVTLARSSGGATRGACRDSRRGQAAASRPSTEPSTFGSSSRRRPEKFGAAATMSDQVASRSFTNSIFLTSRWTALVWQRNWPKPCQLYTRVFFRLTVCQRVWWRAMSRQSLHTLEACRRSLTER